MRTISTRRLPTGLTGRAIERGRCRKGGDSYGQRGSAIGRFKRLRGTSARVWRYASKPARSDAGPGCAACYAARNFLRFSPSLGREEAPGVKFARATILIISRAVPSNTRGKRLGATVLPRRATDKGAYVRLSHFPSKVCGPSAGGSHWSNTRSSASSATRA